MLKKTRIAIDAMGGENSPAKVIEGINISLKYNKENFFFLYGKKDLLIKEINRHKLVKSYSEIIDTKDVVLDNESPLTAAKKSKESSMWKAIESQKNRQTDVTLSAGNTGALLIISRLILSTISGIDRPALAALWPNNKNMSVVLDLGANIECNEKKFIRFYLYGCRIIQISF